MNVVKMILVLLCIVGMQQRAAGKVLRIITLSNALTETVDALGMGASIVAVDVTSEYPAYVTKLPKVSKNRSLSVEGIMAYRPDIVLAPEGDVSKAIAYQLTAAGIQLVTIEQDYSVKGALRFIAKVAEALHIPAKGKALTEQTEAGVNAALKAVQAGAVTPKVLFIYARGAGTMSVAGKDSNMDRMIKLAGGRNAVQEFTEFKTYSTEALIKANPDVILMFDFGAGSLGGSQAVLSLPGMLATNAGKKKNIIVMNGPLLVNFSVRLPEAIRALHQQLLKVKM